MRLRVANKVLTRAIQTGDVPRGSTLWRAVRAMPAGKRRHPKRYIAAGVTAAFLRRGVSIHEQRFMLHWVEFKQRLDEICL